MQRERIWITGASTGIGEALARRLARDGCEVVASARSAEKLTALRPSAAAGLRPIRRVSTLKSAH